MLFIGPKLPSAFAAAQFPVIQLAETQLEAAISCVSENFCNELEDLCRDEGDEEWIWPFGERGVIDWS